MSAVPIPVCIYIKKYKPSLFPNCKMPGFRFFGIRALLKPHKLNYYFIFTTYLSGRPEIYVFSQADQVLGDVTAGISV